MWRRDAGRKPERAAPQKAHARSVRRRCSTSGLSAHTASGAELAHENAPRHVHEEHSHGGAQCGPQTRSQVRHAPLRSRCPYSGDKIRCVCAGVHTRVRETRESGPREQHHREATQRVNAADTRPLWLSRVQAVRLMRVRTRSARIVRHAHDEVAHAEQRGQPPGIAMHRDHRGSLVALELAADVVDARYHLRLDAREVLVGRDRAVQHPRDGAVGGDLFELY
mmetsp:Transcript_71342/g.189787  ORF Transcript_71342/g.189787 Transcript_71342/m.189787 type:complete len:223 (+) Transcript_71342:20-688(+)